MIEKADWNKEEQLPHFVHQHEMEIVVNGYLGVQEVLKRVDSLKEPSRWITNMAQSLNHFEARAWRDMRDYATRFKAPCWALTVVPVWVAAGLAAGVRRGAVIKGPSTLWMFCGMETRRYVSPEETRKILASTLGQTPDDKITDAMLHHLAKRLDRPPTLVGRQPNRQEIYLWATKRRHSEFLRTVALKLGEYIEKDHASPYYEAYAQALEKEGEQSLQHGRGTGISELDRYARHAAVRKFLSEYYNHIQHEEDTAGSR
jgi:hypothetical protein